MMSIVILVVALLLSAVAVMVVKFVIVPYRLFHGLVKQGIPHSPFVPFVGQMTGMAAAQSHGKMLKMMYERTITDSIAQTKKNADSQPVYLSVDSFGPVVILNVNDPRYIASILRLNESLFHRASITRSWLKPVIGEHNLLLEEGAIHALHRRMINPSFRYESLMDMVEIMSKYAKLHVEQWLNQIDQSTNLSTESINPSVEIDLHRCLSALTLDVISASAFGDGLKRYPNADSVVYSSFHTALEAIQWRFHRFIDYIPILNHLPVLGKRSIDRSRADLIQLIDRVVADRKSGRNSCCYANRKDLLDLLLDARDEATGQTLTDEEVRDEAVTFVLAGHETTSSALTWTLCAMMKLHPYLWELVAKEVDSVCGPGATPTAAQLSQLKLTDAILMESMRLWPPVPIIPRQVHQPHDLVGKDLPSIHLDKGLTAQITVSVVHRLPEYWGPRSEDFDHKRWLDDKRPNKHPYQYLPFGGGSRQCIGQQFALLETKCLLAVIAQKCCMKLAKGQPLVDGMPVQAVTVTLRPRDSIKVMLSRRQAK